MAHAGGRPTKFREEMIKDAETLSGLGFTEKDFCAYWQISVDTLYRWKRKNGGVLRGAIERGRVSANITATKELFNLVKNGTLNAITYFLNNRCSELWKSKEANVQIVKVVQASRFENVKEETLDEIIRSFEQNR